MAGQATCGSGAAACIAVDQALAFVDGALVPAERTGIEHRIDACAACRAVVAEAARSAGAELVRDVHGRTSVRRRPAVTAPLRAPGRSSHPAPPQDQRAVRAPDLPEDRGAAREDGGDPPLELRQVRARGPREDRAAPRGGHRDEAGDLPLELRQVRAPDPREDRGDRRDEVGDLPVELRQVRAPDPREDRGAARGDRRDEAGDLPLELRHGRAPDLGGDRRMDRDDRRDDRGVAGHDDRADDRAGPQQGEREARAAAPRDDRPTERGDRASAARADSALVAGDVVGRYVVERPLGAGGMGVVSLARDPELRRPVVIKLVHPNMIHGEGGDELEARLRREAQAMAQVSHTNVVQIFDIGRRGDRVFLAMEFIAGQTLDEWLRERRRTPDEILGVIHQAGAGLAAAHRAGLVHRDLKPSNVLVGRDGVVKVTDFGLARSVVGSGAAAGAGATRQLRVAQREPPRPSGIHAVLTEANAVVGTPAYMAPEQAAGAALDARTDQYALAVTLLDALLGQSPTRRAVAPGAPAEVIDAALADAGIAAAVRAAIVRALAEEPTARFPAIDDFLRALAPPAAAGAAAGAAPARSRRTVLVVAGVALCGIAVVAWFAVRGVAQDCASEAPERWTDARVRVVAAISSAPRPFAGWDAERLATAIDGAVGGLAGVETARCRGVKSVTRDELPGCVARRGAAFTAAIAALSASPPPEDPWPLVSPIERCEAGVPGERAKALRDELRGAAAPRAREIAETARTAGHDRLAADALEAAGLAALAAGDAATADADFQNMATVGERAGDDAVRGRALLRLIAAARWRGSQADGKRAADLLQAMLARHHDAPRDQLGVALAEAEAFVDLGDVATAFAAWDRAGQAASALGDRDAALAAAIGRAWSTWALRFDLAGARRDAAAALAAGIAASREARSAALGIAAELALEARDGGAAKAVLDEATRLVPARTAVDRLRAQRARALLGDVDGALADLVPAASDDANTAARIAIARGKVLLAADHASEASDVLDKISTELRSFNRARAALPNAERIDLELASCEAQLAARDSCKTSYRIDLLVPALHPRAPARARLALVEARGTSATDSRSMRAHELTRALDVMVDAGAAPIRIAELRWEIAQLCAFNTDCRGLAGLAREAFQAAGRIAEVGEIDRWLADQPPTPSWIRRDAGAPDAASPSRRDPWGPQP